MTWQAVTERIRQGAQAGRAWCGREVTARRLTLAVALSGLAFAVGITIEALIRARLPDAGARLPSALYTRPEAWNSRGGTPVALATVSGDPMEYRIPVRLDKVPGHLVDAVLAVEDRRFHDHVGLDLRRIGGALVANVKAGGISQGGSTITQQLAKNLFLGAERTPLRKLREAAMAVVLESRHSKQEILEAYLNEIYLGHDRGAAIHGVGAAARYYFGKDVERLVLSEAATLAAMIRSPNRLLPQRHPGELRARRNLVLELMAGQGRISARAQEQSSRARVPARVHPRPAVEGRWFRDYAAALVPRGVPKRGAAVYTTLDARLQRAAQEAAVQGLVRAGERRAQAAIVAIDPRTGDILAMTGGSDYGSSQYNRAVQARRQPGSAFKPVVALAALERQGGRMPAFTLASAVADLPLQVETAQGPWRPANHDGRYQGEISLREALVHSRNLPFARIGMEVGPARIVQVAERLGIESPLRAVPSLALGSSEVSLFELTRAYGVLAAGGDLARTRAILGVAAPGDPRIAPSQPVLTRVADPGAAFLVTSALQGVVTEGTGRGLNRSGVAGKTGTTNDWRDAWFIAYTPEIVVGVWVGHDDGTSLRRSASQLAVPVAARFFELAGIRARPFPIPDGVVTAYSGGGWFDCGEPEYFLDGTAPRTGLCWDFEPRDPQGRAISTRGLGDLLRRFEVRGDRREAEERLREFAEVEIERLLRSAERRLSRYWLR
jgi:penicillin-binding protein 1B